MGPNTGTSMPRLAIHLCVRREGLKQEIKYLKTRKIRNNIEIGINLIRSPIVMKNIK